MKHNALDYLQLRVLSFYQEALMLKEGRMPAPRMCILYPTYACNHRCAGCDYREINRAGRSLTSDEFDHVIRELLALGIKSIEFCGGGEPTLHPHLTKAMDKFAENRIDFGLLTNGTNLTNEIKTRLVDGGSYCRVSVEAGSRNVFDSYKKPQGRKAGFVVVMKNIEDLVAMREARRADSKLQISYKYSLDMNNYEDALPAVELARKLKVDSIQFKCIRNVPSEIKDPVIIRKLREQLHAARTDYPGFRIVDNLEKSFLNDCRCWLSALQLTVDPYGDVYICCYYRHRMERHKLGNLFARSLRDIWYSEEHWHKISQIETADCNKYDCRFHYYNELMQALVIEDAGQLSFI